MRLPWYCSFDILQFINKSLKLMGTVKINNLKMEFEMRIAKAALLLVVGMSNIAYAESSNVSQQIQLLNSQIQTQLQKVQADQQRQILAMNKQVQMQFAQMQKDLQAQVQSANAQNQEQLKQLQVAMQNQFKSMQIAASH
jgi:hypothetical protein